MTLWDREDVTLHLRMRSREAVRGECQALIKEREMDTSDKRELVHRMVEVSAGFPAIRSLGAEMVVSATDCVRIALYTDRNGCEWGWLFDPGHKHEDEWLHAHATLFRDIYSYRIYEE